MPMKHCDLYSRDALLCNLIEFYCTCVNSKYHNIFLYYVLCLIILNIVSPTNI